MRINRLFKSKDMGRAGIEPDIQYVGDLFKIFGFAAGPQETFRL